MLLPKLELHRSEISQDSADLIHNGLMVASRVPDNKALHPAAERLAKW